LFDHQIANLDALVVSFPAWILPCVSREINAKLQFARTERLGKIVVGPLLHSRQLCSREDRGRSKKAPAFARLDPAPALTVKAIMPGIETSRIKQSNTRRRRFECFQAAFALVNLEAEPAKNIQIQQ